ncbi:MAG: histidine phosphatase family protein [Rhodospirillales bacterium]|nr:histidine phosphatase family protein [Rhodospirillales bacterium]MDE2318969.1 histidine phosphatase family protein [Rhodospirillales bacterium]
MHQLIFLRHAKAEAEARGQSDHNRALTDKGRRAARKIGETMRAAGLAPEVVLVSTASRTQQTLEELESAPVWDEWPNIEALPQLYMATPSQILGLLQGLPETVRSAIVIGHNPGLHELALQLAGPNRPDTGAARIDEGYPTAALAEFLIATTWKQLGHGGASLKRFLLPKDLR